MSIESFLQSFEQNCSYKIIDTFLLITKIINNFLSLDNNHKLLFWVIFDFYLSKFIFSYKNIRSDDRKETFFWK